MDNVVFFCLIIKYSEEVVYVESILEVIINVFCLVVELN